MQNKDSESRKEIELREVKDTVTHDVVHSKYHTYINVFLCFTGGKENGNSQHEYKETC